MRTPIRRFMSSGKTSPLTKFVLQYICCNVGDSDAPVVFDLWFTGSTAPDTHLDQGKRLPLARNWAPENDRYHVMSKTLG